MMTKTMEEVSKGKGMPCTCNSSFFNEKVKTSDHSNITKHVKDYYATILGLPVLTSLHRESACAR